MDNTATIEHQAKKLRRGNRERLLTALVIVLIIIVGGAAAFLAYTFINKRNAPPTTYYDYQLRIQRDNLRRNPKDPAALTNVGYIYMKIGNNRTGLGYLDRALKINDKFVPALYNKGMHYKEIGRRDEAIVLLAAAGKNAVKENKYLAYFSLAELYFEQKEYDNTLKYLNLANEDDPTIWNVYQLRGRIYEIKKDTVKALADYKTAASFNPNDDELNKKIEELEGG